VVIGAARLLREDLRPGVLRIIQDKRDELNQRFLRCVSGGIGLADCCWSGTASTSSEQGEKILLEDEAKYQQDERAADADVHPAELESSATSGVVAAIFDVFTLTTWCPAHGFSPEGKEKW
jgi:hypothetical protein